MSDTPTAIVTGGSSGLGLEISLQLAATGYNVIGVARRAPVDSRWKALEDKKKVQFLTGDVSEERTSEQAVALAEKSGHYNLLVNCAGSGMFKAAELSIREDVGRLLSANLVGQILFCSKSIGPFLKAKGGTIVNVLSTSAQIGRANETVYCAAKWGARGHTEALRAEFKGKPIKIIAVYPGGMRTSFFANAKADINYEKFMDPAEVAGEIIHALKKKGSLQVADLVLNRL